MAPEALPLEEQLVAGIQRVERGEIDPVRYREVEAIGESDTKVIINLRKNPNIWDCHFWTSTERLHNAVGSSKHAS